MPATETELANKIERGVNSAGGGGACRPSKLELLFLEKRTKNFYFEDAPVDAQCDPIAKVFWAFLFKKEPLSFYLPVGMFALGFTLF
jgi:hypothetical protein